MVGCWTSLFLWFWPLHWNGLRWGWTWPWRIWILLSNDGRLTGEPLSTDTTWRGDSLSAETIATGVLPSAATMAAGFILSGDDCMVPFSAEYTKGLLCPGLTWFVTSVSMCCGPVEVFSNDTWPTDCLLCAGNWLLPAGGWTFTGGGRRRTGNQDLMGMWGGCYIHFNHDEDPIPLPSFTSILGFLNHAHMYNTHWCSITDDQHEVSNTYPTLRRSPCLVTTPSLPSSVTSELLAV